MTLQVSCIIFLPNRLTCKPPVTAHVDPHPFCFNSQGLHLHHLTCAEGRDLSNQIRNSIIQRRKQGKWQKALQCRPENSTAHLPFHPSNPKILKVFPECFLTLPTEMKPTRCPVTEKNKQTNQKRTTMTTMTTTRAEKLIFCIWNGSQSAWFINRMLGSFGSL